MTEEQKKENALKTVQEYIQNQLYNGSPAKFRV